jgi:hypothetical protein
LKKEIDRIKQLIKKYPEMAKEFICNVRIPFKSQGIKKKAIK